MADTNGRRINLERVAVSALVHAGPTLARVRPVRRAIVGLIDAWMRKDAALMDPEYEQGMVAYGAAYQELSGEVWKKQYLHAEETGRSESDARIRGKG